MLCICSTLNGVTSTTRPEKCVCFLEVTKRRAKFRPGHFISGLLGRHHWVFQLQGILYTYRHLCYGCSPVCMHSSSYIFYKIWTVAFAPSCARQDLLHTRSCVENTLGELPNQPFSFFFSGSKNKFLLQSMCRP